MCIRDSHYPEISGYPIAGGDPEVLAYLVNLAEMAVDAQDVSGATALHYAAAVELKTIFIPNGGVSKLVELGANVNAKDGDGRTPLHVAAELDTTGLTVAQLIELGSDICARDQFGHTPLDVAVSASMLENAAMFRQAREMHASGEFDEWKCGLWERVAQANVEKSQSEK
eukprot:TRINITY_DN23888_c0_g1_i2.p1 TRINITY_DN23888_c0_g1~~TRINITY_DN23888_c0_g1_i2.p1  ORF type:complete len:170 (+),score=56.63 TRINITY_DN23888_c0_g1_i2:169-678(+)